MWAARDQNGNLTLFSQKPSRFSTQPIWISMGEEMYLDSKLFPNLKWEDEPISVELKLSNDFIYSDKFQQEINKIYQE